jgi:Flp pilus assembly protein TadD
MIGESNQTERLPGLTIAILSAAFAGLPLFSQSTEAPDIRLLKIGGQIRAVPVTETPTRPERIVRGANSTVSADLLRNPINAKARQMLQRALESMKSGDHEAAIAQLLETLAKHPDSAAYAHSLLGVEYLRTDRYGAAVSSFEQAVFLLPHDAVNRYNLGLSLLCLGDYKRGEQEVKLASEIDPNNTSIQALLNALLQRDSSSN